MTAQDSTRDQGSSGEGNIAPGERSLELYDILKEEHEHLGGTKVPDLPPFFASNQITSLTGLAQRLSESRASSADQDDFQQFAQHYIAMLIPAPGWASIEFVCESPSPSDADSAARNVIVDTLNKVISEDQFAEAVRNSKVSRAGVDPYAESMLNRREPEERCEVHRRLIDAAFPSELASIRDVRLSALYLKIHETHRSALCLSGGGIRSATFALGVIQGFARNDLLDKVDYLSTVSGGGYLGAWLSAWSTHTRFDQIIDELKCMPSATLDPEPAAVRHLRSFSNYLSPRLGVLSADTWTIIATCVRNLLLMWIVLVPLLAALAMIPHLTVAIVNWDPSRLPDGWTVLLVGGFAGVGFLCGARAVAFVHKNRPDLSAQQTKHIRSRREERDQSAFIRKCLVPLLVATVLLTTSWTWLTRSGFLVDLVSVSLFGGMFPLPRSIYLMIDFVLFGAFLHLGGWVQIAEGRLRDKIRDGVNITATGAIAGFFAYHAVMGLSNLKRPFWAELYVVLASPVCLALVMLGAYIYTGWTSRRTEDSEREWSARYSAWVLISAVTWLVVSSLVLFGPILFARLQGASLLTEANVIGVLSGIATITLARSPYSGIKVNEASHASGWVDIAKTLTVRYGLAIVAPVFAAFLVILLSLLDTAFVRFVACNLEWAHFCPADSSLPPGPGAIAPVIIAAITGATLAGFGLYMSRLIDTNRFSLHAMYRARLIRAFLGASRPSVDRKPDPFTGFDERDNIPMNALWPAVGVVGKTPPMHVVNLSLNLVGGENLAWQERKAASFTVSPLHAGSATLGYRRTSAPVPPDSTTGPRLYGGKNVITLGTAVTISGAAASPNMGYHSSPAVTFLMTLFNVRLGWWLGNPGPCGDDTFHESAPRGALRPIIDEMFGFTNERNRYVYLSDGGHFENLGFYEMVQRRCKLIVVCDAGADVKYSFEDLGNAIRKIRIDLGVPIDFADDFPIKPRMDRGAPSKGKYWARGRIRYSCTDKPAGDSRPDSDFDGDVIYFKPTFYGNEPRDVFNYAVRHPNFPHESTADQFFNESQFESYRALGSHIVETLCADVAALMQPSTPETEPARGTFAWLAFRAGRP